MAGQYRRPQQRHSTAGAAAPQRQSVKQRLAMNRQTLGCGGRTMRFSMRRQSARLGSSAPRRSCSNVTFWDMGEPLQRTTQEWRWADRRAAVAARAGGAAAGRASPRWALADTEHAPARGPCHCARPPALLPTRASLGHLGDGVDAPMAPAALQLGIDLLHAALSSKAEVDIGPAQRGAAGGGQESSMFVHRRVHVIAEQPRRPGLPSHNCQPPRPLQLACLMAASWPSGSGARASKDRSRSPSAPASLAAAPSPSIACCTCARQARQRLPWHT